MPRCPRPAWGVAKLGIISLLDRGAASSAWSESGRCAPCAPPGCERASPRQPQPAPASHRGRSRLGLGAVDPARGAGPGGDRRRRRRRRIRASEATLCRSDSRITTWWRRYRAQAAIAVLRSPPCCLSRSRSPPRPRCALAERRRPGESRRRPRPRRHGRGPPALRGGAAAPAGACPRAEGGSRRGGACCLTGDREGVLQLAHVAHPLPPRGARGRPRRCSRLPQGQSAQPHHGEIP